ncbi:DUF1565 domain-containing protein [Candidatus Woesebacteria bacterium]|nr:DUF1565 domain-containing protein [Candidatus Woesebacteria bacterium]
MKKTSKKSYLFPLSILALAVLVATSYQLLAPKPTQLGINQITVSGTQRYVAPNGSDTNNGSEATPYKTLGKAINSAGPGDVVWIKPGTYKENIKINNKKGTPDAPIRIVGTSTSPADYPIWDGGNTGYAKNTDNPALTLTNSSWITIERLKFQSSGLASVFVDASHYITFRRNVMDYLKYGVLSRNKSSHLLIEYNEFYQSYPSNSTWTQLKDSKWEGGAYTSFSGAGMNIIRNNYFHDQFNSVFMYRDVRVGNYYDANVWIYRNRFERIVDDPYEPETYAVNNHFFHNTLIDTHRLISLAPEDGKAPLQGPIYVYGNMMILKKDPTKEPTRENSAYKLELSPNSWANGIYLFNNSIDVSYAGTNGSGIDFLSSTVSNVTHINHAYKSLKNVFGSSKLTLKNSTFSHDMATNLGYTENPGFAQDPAFTNSSGENLTLSANSPAKGKGRELTVSSGFSNNNVIAAGADLGAFNASGTDFKSFPSPAYMTPPGGEDSSFPANTAWPADIIPGFTPPSGPSWLTGVVTTPNPTATPTPTPTQTPSTVPSATPAPSPSVIPTPSVSAKPGDLNNDGAVDIKDFNRLISNFGNPYTILDFNLIISNFGK